MTISYETNILIEFLKAKPYKVLFRFLMEKLDSYCLIFRDNGLYIEEQKGQLIYQIHLPRKYFKTYSVEYQSKMYRVNSEAMYRAVKKANDLITFNNKHSDMILTINDRFKIPFSYENLVHIHGLYIPKNVSYTNYLENMIDDDTGYLSEYLSENEYQMTRDIFDLKEFFRYENTILMIYEIYQRNEDVIRLNIDGLYKISIITTVV